MLNKYDKKNEFFVNEDIKDERENFLYLEKYKFGETFKKLVKKLDNKKVVLYGAGAFLEAINKYYNLSELNIVGISDIRFINHNKDEKFLGYNVLSPEEIECIAPDYVLVSTKYYMNIIEQLYFDYLSKTKIKIKPMVEKPFSVLFREIWN